MTKPVDELSDMSDHRFRGVADVVRWAELDPVLTWRTCPGIWLSTRATSTVCRTSGEDWLQTSTRIRPRWRVRTDLPQIVGFVGSGVEADAEAVEGA
jgi:hypothetical protein